MSGEQLTAKELSRGSSNHINKTAGQSKVNINDLLHKVRIEKNKEKKENYIFLGLICGAVAVTGIIASL